MGIVKAALRSDRFLRVLFYTFWALALLFISGVLAIESAAVAQTSVPPISGEQRYQSTIPVVLFAELPACNASNNGQIWVITNAPSATDCSAGGGVALAACQCVNPNWTALLNTVTSGVVTEEDDVEVSSGSATLDFGTGLDITENPAEETNISVDLTEISGDVLSEYVYLTGRAGGQTVTGGTVDDTALVLISNDQDGTDPILLNSDGTGKVRFGTWMSPDGTDTLTLDNNGLLTGTDLDFDDADLVTITVANDPGLLIQGASTEFSSGHVIGWSSGTVALGSPDVGLARSAAATLVVTDGSTGLGNVILKSSIEFEGTTADAFETTISITDPTADRTVTIPNANSSTIQAATCSGTDKVSAVSSSGAITCSADENTAAQNTFLTITTPQGSVGGDAVADSSTDTLTIQGDTFIYAQSVAASDTINIGLNTAGISLIDNPDLDAYQAMFGDLGVPYHGGIIFEGQTSDLIEGKLTTGELATIDKVWTLPDVTGTIITTGDDKTITTSMLGDDSVTAAKIGAGEVGSSELATDSVEAAEIAAGAVGTSEVADGTLTGDDIASSIAGRSLTLTGGTPDTLDADVELYEDTKCIGIESPDISDDIIWWRAERAVTVTGIDCQVGASTSAAVVVNECDSNAANCAAIEASITCATTNTTESGGIDNSSIDAGDKIRVDVGTVTGTVGQLSVCMTYTVND